MQKDVHREVVQTFFRHPLPLICGVGCGAISGSVAISGAHTPILMWSALALIVAAVLRLIVAMTVNKIYTRVERGYTVVNLTGSLLYAAATGISTASVMVFSNDSGVQLLMLANAVMFGSAVAVANAGRPHLAMWPMALAFLPIMAVSLLTGTIAGMALAAMLVLYAAAMRLITHHVFASIAEKNQRAKKAAREAALLRKQAYTDDVTGLANRAGFEAWAAQLIRACSPEHQIGLFWIDLPDFKRVNTELGHDIGDKALVEIAARLRARLPEGHIIARFGSDEFVVIGEYADRSDAQQTAARLQADLTSPVRLNGHRIDGGAAIGMAIGQAGQVDLLQLLREADLALYFAKSSGKSQISVFNSAMTRDLAHRKQIEAELRSAIQKDELSIYFQPIVDLTTGRIHRFEALLRWFHPQRGELRPQEFIPVAEETGLIITLGNWIIKQAASTCATWPADVTLAVNLSPAQIRAPGAALGILQALKEARLDPSRLELEVTESLFLEDDQATAAFMQDLAAKGVGFSLDDFGAGHSSLHYINTYPFRTIKVDRSFVSGADIGRRNAAIIKAIVDMGKTLGLQIIAEGLETVEQVQTLRDAGCNLGQGYYFSHAVPDHVAALLLAQQADAHAFRKLAG